MDNDEICDDEFSLDDNEPEYPSEESAPTPKSVLDSRRRIEELKELRRLRKLLEDDEFVLDYN